MRVKERISRCTYLVADVIIIQAVLVQVELGMIIPIVGLVGNDGALALSSG